MQEREELVIWVEPRRRWAGIGQAPQDGFFGGKVGFEVLVRDGGAGMPEPQRDGREVGARLQTGNEQYSNHAEYPSRSGEPGSYSRVGDYE